MTQKREIDFQSFEAQLAFRFLDSLSYMSVMVTSEENAYGLAGGTWFDGIVDDCFVIANGDLLKMVEITEYIHLDSTCSLSYYECLAERFAKFYPSQILSVNGSTCHFNNTCLPFSLPFVSKNIPICKDTIARNCYMKVMEDLEVDQAKNCKKACNLRSCNRSKSRRP